MENLLLILFLGFIGILFPISVYWTLKTELKWTKESRLSFSIGLGACVIFSLAFFIFNFPAVEKVSIYFSCLIGFVSALILSKIPIKKWISTIIIIVIFLGFYLVSTSDLKFNLNFDKKSKVEIKKLDIQSFSKDTLTCLEEFVQVFEMKKYSFGKYKIATFAEDQAVPNYNDTIKAGTVAIIQETLIFKNEKTLAKIGLKFNTFSFEILEFQEDWTWRELQPILEKYALTIIWVGKNCQNIVFNYPDFRDGYNLNDKFKAIDNKPKYLILTEKKYYIIKENGKLRSPRKSK